mgnify:FL=1
MFNACRPVWASATDRVVTEVAVTVRRTPFSISSFGLARNPGGRASLDVGSMRGRSHHLARAVFFASASVNGPCLHSCLAPSLVHLHRLPDHRPQHGRVGRRHLLRGGLLPQPRDVLLVHPARKPDLRHASHYGGLDRTSQAFSACILQVGRGQMQNGGRRFLPGLKRPGFSAPFN